MKRYQGTILPCPRCMNYGGAKEEKRSAANDRIRNSGAAEGEIDFEAAMWQENDHKNMIPEYDSGDHLHPSLAGAKHMAYSVPEEFFR